MNNKNLTLILLRFGLAITFFYAAIAAFLNPQAWVGFLPLFLVNVAPLETLLPLFSIYEILLGSWLISGWKTFYSATIASLTFLGIIIFNLGVFDIVFRDLGLLFSAVAIVFLSERK